MRVPCILGDSVRVTHGRPSLGEWIIYLSAPFVGMFGLTTCKHQDMAFNCMTSETPQWIERLLNSYRALNFTDTYTYMLELHMVTRRNGIDTPQ